MSKRRWRTGETKVEDKKKMKKTKKEDERRKTFETGERRRKIIYIYSGLLIYLVMVLVDQIIAHQRASILVDIFFKNMGRSGYGLFGGFSQHFP